MNMPSLAVPDKRLIAPNVYDVAVNLHQSSITFGKWVSEVISIKNKHQLCIPKGFIRGLSLLTDSTEFLNKPTKCYAPGHGHRAVWDGSIRNIRWHSGIVPALSARDAQSKHLVLVDSEILA